MKFCVHYHLKRPTDTDPVRHVINDVPGDSPEEAEANAREWVQSQGHEYVSTVRIVKTSDEGEQA